MKNIVISGYFGFNNTGDEAILNATIREIKNNLTNCNIFVISHNAEKTKQMHNVDAIDRMDFNAISNVVSISDLVILGGGGLFQDHHKINIADLFSQSGYGIASYAIVPLIAKMHNKPVFYFAQGIGPLFSKESRSFMYFASELADFITVRDLESEVLLKELCVSSEKILLTADPAIKLKSASEESINRIFIEENIPFSDNYICVNIRSWIDKSIEDSYKKAIAQALDKFAEQKDIFFLFVPFQISEYGDSDYSISKEIIEMMKNKNKCHILKNVYHPTETAKIISKSCFVIGMRYHSIIFAINSHIPFIAISYDQKVTSLVNETGLSAYCLDFNSIDPNIILNKIESVLYELSSVKAKLTSTHEILVKRCGINYQILWKFLENSIQSQFKTDIPKIVDFNRFLNFVYYQSELMYRQQKESDYKIEEKDNKINELQSINVDFKSQVEDKNNKIKELQNTTAHFKFQLEDKNNRIKELQNITADFKSQFEEKSNDVLTLKETVRQRESSLSWKVSQFYGRYFEIDCLLSRSISKILNKLILTKNPKNTTDIFLNFDKESYKELNIMEDFKKFLDAGDNTHICLIFSGTKFVENEGQRPLRLAQEFSKKGYKIIFVGWRWNNKEQIDIGDVFPNVFQIPIDFLVNNYTEILSYSNPSIVNKLFISEFPHPLLFEILSVANSYNWVTIYDVLDDWEEFHKVGNAVWYDKEVESYVAFNSKIVTCVSPTLAEKIKNATNSTSIQVLPNAVSPDMLYTNINEKLPTFIKGKITIGYFGHLTPAWFDWDTIISIANRNPDWTFHIIGYGAPKELQIPNNILLIGKVDPSELGHYASNWDVAIIPFKESVLSSSVDPIKLYEYLFFNLPVVATGIYHIERYPYVWVAHSLNEFEASIIKASETKIEKDVIQKFISENSWSKRVDEIERYASDLFNDGVRI
ncbi:MAG: polysaccharide pyruvyl transferase CsaB [Methanosarcina sp.]